MSNSPEQEAIARQSKYQLGQSGRFEKPIVTEIQPASAYYRASEEHQRHFEKKGTPLPEALQAKMPEPYLKRSSRSSGSPLE